MGKYEELRREYMKRKQKYAEVIPDLMPGIGKMTMAIAETDILDIKTMEMIFVACAIARHCEPCIATHVKGFYDAGGTREELVAVIGVTVVMGGGPEANYASTALEAYDELLAEE
ncbi:carboxymuconolactone decarboxylase family protein [Atopobacter sp. AH10]|uniref:carboxymuconolactone decarboxylase family protein n=1 Tax=Atopobacter sp. AH10 TaxID=2315861 RepID=UPI000EF1E245|nr:carboxymuconolactone decarboxylase family protein [Atopobacter sp. AH10]RLK62740.1 carboxymuconolactone decarboxylase family protein [Atopobacter sp. AH10]